MCFVVTTIDKESGLCFCQHMRAITDWIQCGVGELCCAAAAAEILVGDEGGGGEA